MFNFIARRFAQTVRPLAADLRGLNDLEAEASLPQALDLSCAKRVLVFVPHPDDECMGCGGTLALLAQRQSVQIKVVLVTNGDGGAHSPEPEMGSRRLQEMKEALSVLGIEDLEPLGCLDGRFALDGDLLASMDDCMARFKPNWVFLPSFVDYHKDHLLVANGVLECAQRHSSVEQLLLFETWCPVVATHVVDVTQVMELKIQALEKHHSALKYGDYARCIRALNAYRGLYLGRDRYAEAFGVHSLPMGKTQALDLAVFQKLGMTLKRALSNTL